MKYRLGGRRKVRKPEQYTVELCVDLIREKVKKAKATGYIPATSFFCNSGASDGTITTSSSGGGTKIKAAPQPFSFPVSKIGIFLHVPIETHQKKDLTKTGVPSGKTIKEMCTTLFHISSP